MISQLEPGLERAEVMLGRTSQEVMPGVASGEVRLAARGSDAVSQEEKESQSADAGQSPSVACLAFGEASSGYAGQKEPSLGAGYRVRVRKFGLTRPGVEQKNALLGTGSQNRVLKRKILKQVQTNLWANSENDGPFTDNVLFKASGGS